MITLILVFNAMFNASLAMDLQILNAIVAPLATIFTGLLACLLVLQDTILTHQTNAHSVSNHAKLVMELQTQTVSVVRAAIT